MTRTPWENDNQGGKTKEKLSLTTWGFKRAGKGAVALTVLEDRKRAAGKDARYILVITVLTS